MALPSITDLKFWVGTLFTKDEWDYNFSRIVGWFSDGTADIVVGSIKATNGLDMDGSQIINVGPATSGSQAINLDQANTLLNRSGAYFPFSIASGKVDSNGKSAYLQKDSDTQVTVLAGNVNPDLVCVASDGTIESVTSNTVLTIPATDGTYYIVKEVGENISITSGSSNKVTISATFPTSQNIGDYFLNNSCVPFVGYKYTINGWEETPFTYLGSVLVASGSATLKKLDYNNNHFDVNVRSLDLITPDYSAGVSASTLFASSGTGYTPPGTGLLMFLVRNASIDNLPHYSYLYTYDSAGTQVLYTMLNLSGATGGGAPQESTLCTLFVDGSNSYRVEGADMSNNQGTDFTQYAYFFPLKGAN